MTEQEITIRKRIVWALAVVGLACMVGADRLAGPYVKVGMTVPFFLAAMGTLAFLIAWIVGRGLVKRGGSR